MKVKYKKYERVETIVETDLEYPIYLYFQDECGNDTLIEVNEESYTEISLHYFSTKMEKHYTEYNLDENYLENNLTSKSHYMEAFKDFIES